ncbi:MAG: arginine--tRNA ligase [Bacteroidetes bacterium]|nr:arginine--tRNA ligase [Bacteroidota bacterium]
MKEYIKLIFDEASNKLDYLKEHTFNLEVSKNPDHGDLSCNVAMILSKKLKKKPLEIAAEIISSLDYDNNIISDIKIAGPGFINFYFTNQFTVKVIEDILDKGDSYGKSNLYSGKKANVEYVSANPTGPLTVGHGRNAVVGDTIANILEWVGYTVDREYYFNNAGRQMRVLGDSVKLRYLELLGEKIEFPEDYYQGEYIKDIAQKVKNKYGDSLKKEEPEGIFKQTAEKEIFEEIKTTLTNLNIHHNIFYNEKALYDEGKIDALLNSLKEKNLSYEKDNAIWLKLTELGCEQDKVIVKATGEPTYRLPDIAYHLTKFERGYDLMVDLFGSDHNATYPDVLAGIKAEGKDPEKVKVVIHQFVTIMDKGEIVKMSTRKANYITLDELTNEVGSDVVRYFFNMRNVSTHMNFDLALAKTQSDENPVFYLQYAHARICSILRMIENENIKSSTEHLELLVKDEELQLIKKLRQFGEEIELSAKLFEMNRICNYLEELASLFHKFYTFCRIIGSEKDLAEARISLAIATKTVIKNGLQILGVTAPEKM